MIIEAIVKVITTVLAWLLGLFSFTLPGWFDTSVQTFAGAMSGVGQFGGWIPLGALSDVVVFILAAYALSWFIRLARIVLSAFTGGGGSAA